MQGSACSGLDGQWFDEAEAGVVVCDAAGRGCAGWTLANLAARGAGDAEALLSRRAGDAVLLAGKRVGVCGAACGRLEKAA